MRVAFFVVSFLVVAAPAQASDSCMSMPEARSHFATSHLYWHGPNHCWDATPVRRHEVQRTRHVVSRPAREEADAPTWREAMSEMLPDEGKALTAVIRQVDSDRSDSANWLDRWVDVAQVGGRLIAKTQPERIGALPAIERTSSMITRPIAIFVCFSFLVIFAMVELVFGDSVRE